MPQSHPLKIWQSFRDKLRSKTKPDNGRFPAEILQEIFSSLDFWTLLRCRDVCRFWQQCIPGNSQALRATMFFPHPKHPISQATQPIKLRLDIHIEGELNLALQGRQRTREYAIRSEGGKYIHYLDRWYHGHVNPMLYFDMTRVQLERYHATWNEPGDVKPFWLTMQVGQPPIQDLTIHIVFVETTVVAAGKCWRKRHEVTETLHNPNGVTLGEMLSKTNDMIWWPKIKLKVPGEKEPVILASFKQGAAA